VKYLVKDLGDDLDPTTSTENTDTAGTHGESRRRPISTRRRDHVARLVEALRYEPCSPTCPNWLRYGIQPKNPRPGMRPGHCAAKAHRPSHLGYGGRRVLVSRKWTGKDLPDHRHDRKAHVLAVLAAAGHLSATDGQPSERVRWEYAQPSDPDIPPAQQRLLRRIAHAVRRRDEYRRARDGTEPVAAQHESQTDCRREAA
jgi:hypothetical protein